MRELTPLAPWIKRFFLEYLTTTRNLARSTQVGYRDTLRALIRHTAQTLRKRPDQLHLEDLSQDRIKRFLYTREQQNKCGPRTTNRSLAALHTFARFIGQQCPQHLQWSGEVLSIPFKKFPQPTIPYLEKAEMDALLAAPSLQSPQGRRDHALLLFLYNTGARASEAAHVTVQDIQLRAPSDSRTSFVVLHGKGGKTRLCPLWPRTAKVMSAAIDERPKDQNVFINRCGRPLTRFGIHAVVERYADRLKRKIPGLGTKRVSPHTIRHTTASHLLRAGVDINTIRAWLGHVSIDTTNVYAQIDIKMKANALEKIEPRVKSARRQRLGSDIMRFLESL
jgi:site-specific recombinase XerD